MTKKTAKPATKGKAETLRFPKAKSAAKGAGKSTAIARTHRAPGALKERSAEPFKLGAVGLIVDGNPTFEQYAQYWDTLKAMSNSAMWAVGDMLKYGEERQDWKGDMYVQVIDETKTSVDSAMNYLNIAKKFPLDRRRLDLSFSHHRLVSGLPELDQDKWLDVASKEQLSVRQLKARMDDAKAAKSPKMDLSSSSNNDVVTVVMVKGEDSPRSVWDKENLALRDAALINRNEGKNKIIASVKVMKVQTIEDADGDVDQGEDGEEQPPL